MSPRGQQIAQLFAEFGERLARILDAEDGDTERAKTKQPAKRRAPLRTPPKPTREIDDATRAKARAMMRRAGIHTTE